MKKSFGIKLLSLLLTLSMLIGCCSVAVFAENVDETAAFRGSVESEGIGPEPGANVAAYGTQKRADDPDVPSNDDGPEITSYSDFMSSLLSLENYAAAYSLEHVEEEPVALVINYIRTGVEKYNSGTWNTFCGEENTAFVSYVAGQDSANGTNSSALRNLGNFTIPNGDEVEFSHMFGCMDMAYHTGNQATADLGSWAGDICDLVQLSQNFGVSGTVEQMAEQIRTDNENLFLYDNPHAHSFGLKDFYGDLDAFYILKCIGDGKTISSIMRSYFTENLNDSFRCAYFLENRLGGVKTKSDIRNAVFEIYTGNEGIYTLEGTYLPEGVNSDIRKACCFAFADHLYLTALDRLDNPYYTTFSNEKSNLAPGVTQEIKMAISADNKQMVYYLATADVARDDVSIFANYGDNDGSVWKMARVSDQVAAAQAKHSNPDDEANYIPNYNAVASVNADFYNMSNGAVTGTLIMEGVEYHSLTSSNFFGVLDDGTPVIGGRTEWNQYHDRLREAVGASIWLVKDGKIAVTATSNYYNQRASRTAVGITYDGRVVLMVLDGRQEPFSCGGSSIEIAQIMLDAGCVKAINLDGGGSSTYVAKLEGSDTCSVVNRPSDGYERSVSSSLLVVSTAKPSNVFDHAVVSADYDYLTVGSELSIRASGVTATGGAIDLPEDSFLQVSDNSIGTISGDTFTASALGDVQVQVVSADGDVLGSKTLHVVEPTVLKFSKESLNAVYGEPEALPLEATFEGKNVKINPNDVIFGYLKVSLESIGNVEGGAINTTRTQLVMDYPEAGSMTDFSFTANEDGGLRTLTIGAVLTSKFDEFQAVIAEESMRVYQEALQNGFTVQEAQLQSEAAAISKGLDTAAKIKLYLYSGDEANFDFDQETGTDGMLLHWRRDVSNARYQREINMYYQLDPSEPMTTNYTFAVDMSKMPIPQKLTGLLYMLPGGDQEGRTAWSFLLQLAERISPLTTVTVKLQIPEGFDVDYSDLKLVNEYFDLTSAEIDGNELTIVGNFKLQTEPINPTTANPLCVLSGLKLTPNDSAAWDANEPDQLDVTLTGTLNYDIYAHFHVLKSLAQQEMYQVNYGLFPYDNSANIPLDYGAHFSSDSDEPVDFSDQYRLNRECKEGWIYSQGSWSYYEGGVALTGPQFLPSFEDGEEGSFWYDLGAAGSCTGKLTGIFEKDGNRYYARMGQLVTGWQSVVADDGESYFYYFDKKTGVMYTGVRAVDGLTYTFNDDGQLIRGAFRTNSSGTKYFVAGQSWFRRFVTLEEGTYWIDVDGYVAYGNAYTVTTSNKDITWYHFDEQTGLMTGLCSGLFDYRGKLYWCDENGKVFYGAVQLDDGIIFTATRGLVYTNTSCYISSTTAQKGCNLEVGTYWCGPDGYIQKDGFATINGSTYYFDNYSHVKGFTKIGDDYYLFNAGSGKMAQDAMMWVNANSYGVETGMHYFDESGKMFVPDLENGVKAIINEDGELYFTVDGVKMTNGLYELDGEYYYAQPNGQLVTGKAFWVAQKNNLIPEKGDWHYFDADGKMLQTGFVNTTTGLTYYYDSNVLALGFTKIGEDYYFFNAANGNMYKDTTLWVTSNSYGVAPGYYYFAADGKLFVPDTVNGKKAVVNVNGTLYFTIDGVRMSDGLNELDGDLYYAQTNCQLAVNKTVLVSQKKGLLPDKGSYYAFGADGKLIKTGFVEAPNNLKYYYDNTVLALGFTKIGEDYYFFNAANGNMYRNTRLWVGTNALGVKPGYYNFGTDGKMTVE
ncbi:MAG: phosphodiester glycosidase family protein [Clostridia bacterium]|nr:phosphodiester glycosidase family protein [Clostridia bacterium]